MSRSKWKLWQPTRCMPAFLTSWKHDVLLLACFCFLLAVMFTGLLMMRDPMDNKQGELVYKAMLTEDDQDTFFYHDERGDRSLHSVGNNGSRQVQNLKDLVAAGKLAGEQKQQQDRVEMDMPLVWPRDRKENFLQKVTELNPERQAPGTGDFAIAIASQRMNEDMLRAGRASRLGMQAYIATNYEPAQNANYPAAANEKWEFFPDDDPVRSFYAGDSRAAMVPFLAYQALGESFKWLFYGDDDTLFLLDGAFEIASRLDPNMPYFLTDNIWWSDAWVGAKHPHQGAPRCLPCSYNRTLAEKLPMEMVTGCPCTPQLLCGLEGGLGRVLSKNSCGIPRTPIFTYSMHGGAGALISIGLLRSVSHSTIRRSVMRSWNSGGDAFITTALWEAGLAITDPGPMWHPEGLTRFDLSPAKLHPDEDIVSKAAHMLGNLFRIVTSCCEGLCKLEVMNAVSLHLRAQRISSSRYVAAVLFRAFSRFYALHTGRLQGQTDVEVAFIHDTGSQEDLAFAERIDKRFAEGVELLRQLQPIYQKKIAKGGRANLLVDKVGKVAAVDRARTAAAAEIARQILELTIADARAKEESDRSKHAVGKTASAKSA